MPESNLELHRRSVASFNERDVEKFISFCDTDIELHSTVTVPGGAVYHGHDGVRRWQRDLEDGWGDELQIEPEAYYDLGGQTITFHVLHGKGRQSGADVAMPAAHLCRWRNGLMVFFKGYSNREDVFEDLQIAPDTVSPIAP
jgi:ketosteroid isomerase-like protein